MFNGPHKWCVITWNWPARKETIEIDQFRTQKKKKPNQRLNNHFTFLLHFEAKNRPSSKSRRLIIKHFMFGHTKNSPITTNRWDRNEESRLKWADKWRRENKSVKKKSKEKKRKELNSATALIISVCGCAYVCQWCYRVRPSVLCEIDRLRFYRYQCMKIQTEKKVREKNGNRKTSK